MTFAWVGCLARARLFDDDITGIAPRIPPRACADACLAGDSPLSRFHAQKLV
jgi:hypothetical protein